MPTPDPDQEKARQEQELKIQRQIAFASGFFQGDVTIRTLLESLVEGVVIVDSSGTILFVNSRTEQMFGYPEKELIGKPHSIIIPERFRKIHNEHEMPFFAEPRSMRTDQIYNLAGRRLDGSEFPVEINLGFIETNSNVLVLALISDITQRKQFESRLRESEELFRIQLECVKDYAIFMLDPQGNVLNWNAGAERLRGYRAEEIIGKHFSCFFPEEARNAGRPEENLKKASAKGFYEEEGWRIRKDGSRFWGDEIITAIRDENGNLRGFSNVTRDITERKKTEDALHFSETRYRALFRDNPTMIVTLDAELKMLSVNPACARILGYAIDELEGQPVLKLFHDDDRPAVTGQLRRCLENPDQVYHWQIGKICKDGAPLWVEETAQAVFDLDGALNILVVCHDVTERKRAEDERERLLLQLEAVLNSISEGVVIFDLEGNILTMNPSAVAIHDYESIEQVRQQRRQYREIFELYDLDGLQVPFDQWPVSRALRGERFADYEVRVLRKNTGKSWVCSYSGTPVHATPGDIILVVNTMRDISDRKRAEDELRHSEERYRRLYNDTPVMLHTIDHDGRLVSVSNYWLETLGYERDEVLGRRTTEFFTAASRSYAIEVVLPEFYRTGSCMEVPYQIVKKNGEIMDILLSAIAERDSEGKIVHAMSVMVDITERKLAEEEIGRLNVGLTEWIAELDIVNKDLGAFNYTVAHDLRQPLNVIGLSCQAIKELYGDQLPEECLEYIQDTYNGVVRMNQLIEALLNFSRIGHVELHREKVSLGVLAQEVARMLKQSEPGRQVDFRIADGITANADANLVRVVLDNLLGNAWKYTGKQEKAVIEFGATEIGGKQFFFVRDNGAGFDKAASDKLFKPFQRLPGAEEFKGSGIGLATAERIIQRHGGRIWAEGEPGKGATFYFTLSADGDSN